MKKITVILIVLIVISVGFLSGCETGTKDTDNDGVGDNSDTNPTGLDSYNNSYANDNNKNNTEFFEGFESSIIGVYPASCMDSARECGSFQGDAGTWIMEDNYYSYFSAWPDKYTNPEETSPITAEIKSSQGNKYLFLNAPPLQGTPMIYVTLLNKYEIPFTQNTTISFEGTYQAFEDNYDTEVNEGSSEIILIVYMNNTPYFWYSYLGHPKYGHVIEVGEGLTTRNMYYDYTNVFHEKFSGLEKITGVALYIDYPGQATYDNIHIYNYDRNTSDDGEPVKKPDMTFNKQTTPTNGLTLVSADPGLSWVDFMVTGAVAPTGAVMVGQFIPLANMTGTITIVHKPTNTLIGTFTWADSSINRIAVIDTTMGTIRVGLYEDKMPITTANFIKLATDGFYNDLVFHRVIDNFMIQGGGFYPNGNEKQDPYGAIKLETSPDVHHIDGTISMARSISSVDSATSQFFICDGVQTSLDGQYAAFGKVIEGMDVVRAIAGLDPSQTTTKYGYYQNWPVNDVIINSVTIVSS